jgi:hypothetical protein
MFQAVPCEGSTCNSLHCFNRGMRRQVRGKEERLKILPKKCKIKKKNNTLMEKQTQHLKT